MSDYTKIKPGKIRCYNRCGKWFESEDDMVAVGGKGNRSPRLFCEPCAEKVRRGPPV